MTTLDLTTLSARIRAHKNTLIHIVKPPVCTERAQHYTEAYQQHQDKPLPVRRAWRWPTIWRNAASGSPTTS